jgi:hypothetical protein
MVFAEFMETESGKAPIRSGKAADGADEVDRIG